MLYYNTFYYTYSVIVSDLKIRSLQILHTEHYGVSLCRTETISFFSNYIPVLENKRSLATDVAGIASSRLATAATDAYFWRFVEPTRTVDFGYAKMSARRGKLPVVDAWRRVVSGRRRRYSIAGLRDVQFVPQARRRCGVACRCSGRQLWGADIDSSRLPPMTCGSR